MFTGTFSQSEQKVSKNYNHEIGYESLFADFKRYKQQSPKLNLIEILWKFIKYEWIEIDAYDNQNNLIRYLKKVLDNFGTEYVINFV